MKSKVSCIIDECILTYLRTITLKTRFVINQSIPLSAIVAFFILSVTITSQIVSASPIPDNIFVSDVTTNSFSVIWSTSEACNASLEVYEDIEGLYPITDMEIIPHPTYTNDNSIKEQAENNGVMKVTITGLQPDSTYYFRTISTSKISSESTVFPESTHLLSVTTAHKVERQYNAEEGLKHFGNDIIIEPCYLADGTTVAEGTLLVASITGADYPLTAFVGDGVELPYAFIDLNNAFSNTTKNSLDLIKGEHLALFNFRGLQGNSVITFKIPEDHGLCEAKAGDAALSPGWNMFSPFLEPDNSNVMDVFFPIWDQLEAIWAYDEAYEAYNSIEKNMPSAAWTIDQIDALRGYFLRLNTDVSVKMHGNFSSSQKQLYPGWNFVGSKWINSKDLLTAVTPISEQLDSVWYYDPESDLFLSFSKDTPTELNTLNTIEPGKAYLLLMNERCNDPSCVW